MNLPSENGRTKKYRDMKGNLIDGTNHIINGRRYVYVVKWLQPGLKMPKITVHKSKEGAQRYLHEKLRRLCISYQVDSMEEIYNWDFRKTEREAVKLVDGLRPPKKENPYWLWLWAIDYAEVMP